jgi:hypothetical protein
MASRKDIVAGGASLEIRAVDYTKQVFNQVHSNLSHLGSSFTKFGASMTAAAGAAAIALTAFTVATASSAAAVDDAAKRTGVGVETLQELRHGAEQSGASFETLVKGFQALAKAMDSKKGAEAIERLGIDLDAFLQLEPENKLTAIASALAQFEDPAEQAAIAMELFGKAGYELLPFLKEGEEGINRMRGEAQELGQVINSEGVAALAALDDAAAKVTGSVRGLAGTLAGQLAPYIEPVANAVAEVVASFSKWLEENSSFSAGIVTSIGVVAFLGANLTTLGFALTVVSTAFTAVGAVASVVGAAFTVASAPVLAVAAALTALAAIAVAAAAAVAFLALPFIDLEAAISAAGAAIVWLQNVATAAIAAINAVFGNAFTGMVDAFANGELQTAAKIAFLGLQLAASGALDQVLAAVRSTLQAIDDAFRETFGQELGFEEYFASETGLGNLEKANEVKRSALKQQINDEAAAQASIRKIREDSKAAEEAQAAQDMEGARLSALLANDYGAADTAGAIASAGKGAKDLFEVGGGTSASGASAFMGGVTWFKPLEDESKKQTEHLAAIRKQTRDGMGAQIV